MRNKPLSEDEINALILHNNNLLIKLKNKMSVQKHLFNPISQSSPVIPTYDLKKSYDEEGNLVMTWEKTNGDLLIRANGSADVWSLDALMKAGINPADMNIHTGYNTRLDGINDLQSVAAEVEAAVNNNEKNSNE